VDLISSFTPAMREAVSDCFGGAAIHVDTEAALDKTSEVLATVSRVAFGAADVRGTMTTPARCETTGRRSGHSPPTAL